MKLSLRKTIALGGIFLLLLSIIQHPIRINAQQSPIKEEGEVKTMIKLDPSYQHKSFEGWGTALVWFANITGGWPDHIKNELADALFGEDGLNFNIARYNIGGEDSPETEPYMRLGGAVPGYWNRPAEYSPPENAGDDWEEPDDWWDPNNPDHWDWDKDQNQQWWLEAAKKRGANLFEAFSNSPPYFMTNSGYTSGNFDSWEDNLQRDKFEEFAIYLTRVVQYLEEEKGIDIHTLSPVNEPNTGYWGALGRQEGSNWSPESQAKIIKEVSEQLKELQLGTVVSAMDETNPQKFRQNWEQYDVTTKENVGQMNVHTYWPGERTAVRDLAKGEKKRLWMSEVDLGGSVPQDFDHIEPGLELSERIASDIMNLEPRAWVLWQAIEDQINMNEDNENSNWGLVQVDFDPDNFDELEWHKNKKYYTMANYSKFIRPGYNVINTDNNNTLAAINKENQEAVVVYTNHTENAEKIDIDLSGFDVVKQSASAVPYTTSADSNLTQGETIQIENDQLITSVAPKSVTTFVISGVSGVKKEEVYLSDNKVFKLENKHSQKVLDVEKEKAVQYSTERGKVSQEWKIEKITDSYTTMEKYRIVNKETNQVLTHQDGKVILAEDSGTGAQQWIISTTGKEEYMFINVESRTLLEIGGQSKEEGASAGVWKANAGANQAWRIFEAGITKLEDTTIWTSINKAPRLPEAVIAHYGNGDIVEEKVIWEEISSDQYEKEGKFTVEGKVAGTDLKAKAIVYVSEIVNVIEPKLKTVIGNAPSLPSFVEAQLAIGEKINVPVDWEEIDQAKYDELGQFTVHGLVTGSTQKVIAKVQVREAAIENIALQENVEEYPAASASFTGQWDDVDRINDGDYSSNRWTNWDPNEWREKDWIQIDFGKTEAISEVRFTFYDDEGGTRPPESLYLEYWNGSDWTKIKNSDAIIEDKDEKTITFDEITTSKIRAQLKAMPETCIAVVEMEVMGVGDSPIIGEDATLTNILVNEEKLEGFRSDQFTYELEVDKETDIPSIIVTPTDLFATYEVVLPDSVPGKASIIVTSEDQENTNTYQVHFTVKQNPDDGKGTIAGLTALFNSNVESEEISGPMVKVMSNRLRQAEKHYRDNKLKQTIKSLEDFQKHLTSNKNRKHVSESTIQEISHYVDGIVTELEKK